MAKDASVHVVVVGAQKASSTTLAASLGEHPDVEMAPGEFHGFLDAPYAAGQSVDILSAFRDPGKRYKAFKCASYLADPQVPARLHDDLRAPHIVIGLRSPIERAVSAWYWYIRTGLLPAVPAEEGISAVLDGRAEGHRWRHAREVLDWGLYGRHLQRYLLTFGTGKVHVVTDLDLRADPDGVMQDLVSALGLPPHPMSSQRRRSNEGIYSMPRLRWLNTRQRLLWQQDDQGIWSQGRPKALWKRATNAGVVAVDRLVLAHLLDNSVPGLSPSLHERLAQFYADDVRVLEQLLGRDLDPWWQPRTAAAPSSR